MHTSRHIFLTGFMGSGKSLLGKKVAAALGMTFIDLDHHIEQSEKTTISRLFQLAGEAHFRELETRHLAELIALPAASVIALGGGTVCFNNNLDAVKQAGLLVYIELTAAELTNRLKKSRQPRPLLQGLSEAAMTERIAKLLAQRKSYYEQAQLTVNGLNLTSQGLCTHIIEFQKTHNPG